MLDHDPDRRASIFTIELPRILEQPSGQTSLAPKAPASAGPDGNREILVVDDEERILNLFRRVLSKEGFHVTTTERGQEALKLIEERPFGAFVVDYHLPDVNGRAIAEHLIQNRPELISRLILTTGDDQAEDFKALSREAGAVTLAKPFQIREMLSVVNGKFIQETQPE